jgi:hypothetical protein
MKHRSGDLGAGRAALRGAEERVIRSPAEHGGCLRNSPPGMTLPVGAGRAGYSVSGLWLLVSSATG